MRLVLRSDLIAKVLIKGCTEVHDASEIDFVRTDVVMV